MSGGWRGLSADLDRVATAAGRAGVGCFSIEGTRLHERALAAGSPPRATLVGRSVHRAAAPRVRSLLARLAEAGSRIEVAPDEELQRLTEGRSIGALVSLVPLPAPRELDEIVQDLAPPATLLVAVEVEDPGNVGALVRTALASGAAAYVAVGIGDPFHPRAVRTSMGSLFRIPLLRLPDAQAFLDRARRTSLRTVAAVSRGGAAPRDVPRDRPVALCIGSEAQGLSPAVLARIEHRATIPMGSPIDSYSVNAAAAILLWELGPSSGGA